MTGSKLGKEYIKAVYFHPAYLTYMQSTSCGIPGWMKHKLESRFLGEISTTPICRWYHSNGRKWKGTKEPLDEGERGEQQSWLEIQHSKKIRSWHPVPSLHSKQKGGKWKQRQILFSWAPQSLQMVTTAIKVKDAAPGKESYGKTRQHIKK